MYIRLIRWVIVSVISNNRIPGCKFMENIVKECLLECAKNPTVYIHPSGRWIIFRLLDFKFTLKILKLNIGKVMKKMVMC